MSEWKDAEIGEVVGRRVVGWSGGVDDDVVTLRCDDGTEFRMLHEQNCCEVVTVNEIHGDMDDLAGVILAAEEVSSHDAAAPEGDVDSYTWTFYRLSTIKGTVVIRWLGTSNGYYSESVDVERRDPPSKEQP